MHNGATLSYLLLSAVPGAAAPRLRRTHGGPSMEDGLLVRGHFGVSSSRCYSVPGMIAGAVTWLAWFLGVQMALLWRELRDRPPTAR